MTAWLSRTQAAHLITYSMPLLLLVLQPVFWFPNRFAAVATLVLATTWVFRTLILQSFSIATRYDAPVIALLLWLPVTALPVTDWSLATPKYVGVLVGIAMIYAIANSVQSRRGLTIALLLLVFGGAILAALCLVLTDWPAQKAPAVLDAVYQRLPLIASLVRAGTERGGIHPNQVAGILVLLAPTALAVVFMRTTRLPYWFAIATGTLAITGVIVLTVSRAGLIGLAVGMAFPIISVLAGDQLPVPGRRPARLAGGIMAIGIAIASVVAIQTWLAAADTGIDSYSSRVGLYERALQMVNDMPLTGVGMGQFPLVMNRLYAPEMFTSEEFIPHAHNFIVQLAADLGLPGMAAVIIMMARFVIGQIRVFRHGIQETDRLLAAGMLGSMAGFLVYGQLDAIALGARGFIVFWIILGLGEVIRRITTPEPRPEPARSSYSAAVRSKYP